MLSPTLASQSHLSFIPENKVLRSFFAYIYEASESLNSTEILVPTLVCLLKILLKRDQDASDSLL